MVIRNEIMVINSSECLFERGLLETKNKEHDSESKHINFIGDWVVGI